MLRVYLCDRNEYITGKKRVYKQKQKFAILENTHIIITQKESKVIHEQECEGYSRVFISTDSVQKCIHNCVLCKERGMGQENLNRPKRNAIKSTQLCVVLLLERTLPCS